MSPPGVPARSAGPGPLPVVVIGGYLGAGKTTLVNHLLRQAAGRRIAVLVNDFGDIAIDAELIAADHPDGASGVLNLAGGCLCCSFGDDLVGTLATLTRRQPAPDVVLIELSGVALPATVVRTAQLAPGVAVAGTLVLADAGAVQRQATDRYLADTVRQQLREADWLLLNKPDLADADALTALATRLAGWAPQARLVVGRADALPVDWLLDWRDDAFDGALAAPDTGDEGVADLAAWASRAIARPPAAAASAQAAELFASHSLSLPPGTDLAALGRALAAPDSGVLRAKGLAVDAEGRGQLLQVAGGRWAVTPAAWSGPGRLVVIGLRAGAGLDDAVAALGAETPGIRPVDPAVRGSS